MKTEQEWLAIFKAWEESGLPQPEFCQSRGLGYAQFSLKRGELIAKGVIARYKRPIRLGKEIVPALPTPTFTPIAFSQPVPLPSVHPKKPESTMIEIGVQGAMEQPTDLRTKRGCKPEPQKFPSPQLQSRHERI